MRETGEVKVGKGGNGEQWGVKEGIAREGQYTTPEGKTPHQTEKHMEQ